MLANGTTNGGIQLLPSTSRSYKRTKREFFARRMAMMDHALLIISFHGVMGDFSKTQLLINAVSNEKSSDILGNLNVRIGLIKGLRFLCQYF